MDHLARINAALADTTRLRLLSACFGGERCVCQLVALVALSNAAVSKHLSILRDAGLLAGRKEGRWVHLSLPDDPTPPVAEAIGWVRRHASGDPTLRHDAERMQQILSMEPAALCRLLRDGEPIPGGSKECC